MHIHLQHGAPRAPEGPDGTAPWGTARAIWKADRPRSCVLVVGRKENHELFDAVLRVRCATDERWPDQNTPVDDYSDQYCMFVDHQPVGCLGVTWARDGALYLGEFAPPALLEHFGHTLVSAYRFRILSAFRRSSGQLPELALSRHMVREAWREQMTRGATLDVIQTETTYAGFYQRMGYIHCEGYDYIDPILGTPSSVMCLPTDPDRESIIQDIVRESGTFLTLENVLRVLTRKQVAISRTGQ